MSQETTIRRAIVSPRITEKAARAGSHNCYVFNVTPESNKQEIAKEITELYQVTPVRVNIAKSGAKKTFFRGVRGTKKGVKKAYVYLKEGDKINIM